MEKPRAGRRSRGVLAACFLAAAVAACTGPTQGSATKSSSPISITEREARDAIAFAIAYLPTVVKSADDYRLISVYNILTGEDPSPARWLVGFKLRSLIPDRDDGKIGKGGDLFVEVTTTTRQVVTAIPP